MTASRLTFVLALLALLSLAVLPACRSRCCPSDCEVDAPIEAPADDAMAPSGSASDDAASTPKPKRRRKINAQSVWLRRCAKCHGMTGGGGKGPRLVGRGALRKFATRQELAAYVVEHMPPNGPRTDEDVAMALADFAFKVNKRR